MQKDRIGLSFKKLRAVLPACTDDVDPRVARLKSLQECRSFISNALERKRPDLALQALHRIATFNEPFGRSRSDQKLMTEVLSELGVVGGGDANGAAA